MRTVDKALWCALLGMILALGVVMQCKFDACMIQTNNYAVCAE